MEEHCYCAVVTSRVGRGGEVWKRWRASIQQAIETCREQGWPLAYNHRGPMADWIGYAADQCELPEAVPSEAVPSEAVPSEAVVASWKQVAATASADEDRRLIEAAPILFIAHLRRGGLIESLVDARLARMERPTPIVAAPASLIGSLPSRWPVRCYGSIETPPKNGCDSVLRHCDPRVELEGRSSHRPEAIGGERIRSLSEFQSLGGDFLFHWTRGSVVAWPGEEEWQWRQRRWRAAIDADDGTPLQTLCRIVAERRLRASARWVRGTTPVVSFTSLPLPLLRRHRTYRKHLHRWDAEPYGVGIERRWLQAQGARPVVYRQLAQAPLAARAEDPFVQWMGASSGRSAGGTVDWRTEREWRIAGDVRLDHAPGLVFVPDAQTARRLPPLPHGWFIVAMN
jgi:hypothetical protein